jgi:hypothetical protein
MDRKGYDNGRTILEYAWEDWGKSGKSSVTIASSGRGLNPGVRYCFFFSSTRKQSASLTAASWGLLPCHRSGTHWKRWQCLTVWLPPLATSHPRFSTRWGTSSSWTSATTDSGPCLRRPSTSWGVSGSCSCRITRSMPYKRERSRYNHAQWLDGCSWSTGELTDRREAPLHLPENSSARVAEVRALMRRV